MAKKFLAKLTVQNHVEKECSGLSRSYKHSKINYSLEVHAYHEWI